MRWPEEGARRVRALLTGVGLLSIAALAPAADEPARRYSAPVQIDAPAALIRLALPASAYARSLQPGLADLRIVDADAQPVPFAVLPPRPAEIEQAEIRRPVALYALPARPAAGGEWASPVEVSVVGDRISVKRRGAPAGSAAAGSAKPVSGGWLFDLGERKPGDLAPQALHLAWSAPAEFSAGFELQTSADLRQWRPAGGGQLLALASRDGPLVQPRVLLPEPGLREPGRRFVRLVWAEPASAPLLSGAEAVAREPRTTPLDPPSELLLAPLPAALPNGPAGADPDAARALDFDLGGVLPVVGIDLQLGPGHRVSPLRVLGRERADAPWRPLATAVFFRFERGAASSVSAPLALRAEVRQLRLVADPRSPPLDPAVTRLVVRADLAQLVFAQQGRPPYGVQTGAAQPAGGGGGGGALPLATLVPRLDEERARFGVATLGGWSEDAGVARRAESDLRLAAWRPALLWGVLLAGVAGLGFMVWRLARAPKPAA